jgi:hypothetical protein
VHLDVAQELEPVVADALNCHYRLPDIDWSMLGQAAAREQDVIERANARRKAASC